MRKTNEYYFIRDYCYDKGLDQNDPEALKKAKEAYTLSQERNKTMKKISEIVIRHYRVNRKEFFSSCRKRELSDARQVFMRLARTYTLAAYQEIGRFLNRDHSTVIHGIKVVDHKFTDHDFMIEFTAVAKKVEHRIKGTVSEVDAVGFSALLCAVKANTTEKSYERILRDYETIRDTYNETYGGRRSLHLG